MLHAYSKRLLVLLFLFLGSFLVFAAISHAQEQPFNLTASPQSFDLTAVPGNAITERIRIRNNNDTPITLRVTVDKLLADQQGNITVGNFKPNEEQKDWISFPNATVAALPKEWTDIPFTLAVPKTAGLGYYYAIRIGQENASGSANTTGAKLLGEIVIPVLLSVRNSNAKIEGSLVTFSAPIINEYLPVDFTVTIANTGNVHIRPTGNIFIQRSSGKEQDITTLDVNAGLGAILPQSSRTFISSWTDGFLVEEPVMEDGVVKRDSANKPINHLVVNWDKLTNFRIGKYTANLLMVYDNGKRDVTIEGTTTFWVFPYKIIGGAVAGLIILIFGIRYILTWYIRREINKQQRG